MSMLLNLSGVYREEGWDEAVLHAGGTVTDLAWLEGCNSYCDDRAAGIISAAAASEPLSGINWIDTGDYHYITLFNLMRIGEPFVLFLFDHHSDRQDGAFAGADILSCGNWVARALESLPMLKSVSTIGASAPEMPVPDGLPAYVSLDLDVMSESVFRTNWDQGDMLPEELFARLDGLFRSRRVLGVDVCGGKTLSKGASEADLRLNLSFRSLLNQKLIANFEDCY